MASTQALRRHARRLREILRSRWRPTYRDRPQWPTRSDLLIKRRLRGAAIFAGVLIATEAPRAETRVAGPIDTDTTWSAAAGPYLVSGDLVVTPSSTLTITAGTVVRFSPKSRLDVSGRLEAKGDPVQPILFTSTDPHAGAWKGVRIWQKDAARASHLSYVSMSYGGTLEIGESTAVLDYMTVAESDGILIRGSSDRVAQIRNSTIVRNRGCGITVLSDGRPVLSKTAILMNEGYAICIGQGFYPRQSPTRLLLSEVTASGNGGGSKDAIEFTETVSAGDETLTPGLDWVINNWYLEVRTGATLTILPGTVLRFGRGLSLIVHGTLIANGTPERPVNFKPSGSERWGGIHFKGQCSGSLLRNTILFHSERAVYVDNCAPRFENISVQDSLQPPILIGRAP